MHSSRIKLSVAAVVAAGIGLCLAAKPLFARFDRWLKELDPPSEEFERELVDETSQPVEIYCGTVCDSTWTGIGRDGEAVRSSPSNLGVDLEHMGIALLSPYCFAGPHHLEYRVCGGYFDDWTIFAFLDFRIDRERGHSNEDGYRVVAIRKHCTFDESIAVAEEAFPAIFKDLPVLDNYSWTP